MAIRASMNVSVTPELESFVQELVASGRYHSASEVFRDGLRLLEKEEQRRLWHKFIAEGLTPDEEKRMPAGVLDKYRAEMNAKIQEGLDDLARGEYVDGREFMAQLKKRLEAMRTDESFAGRQSEEA